MAGQSLPIQNVEGLHGSYYFRYDEFAAESQALPHCHSWGHLNYAAHGSMRMDTPALRLLSPPQYGVWIPPGVEHSCYLPTAVVYRSVYMAPDLCAQLPQQPCSLRIGPIIKAILADFAARDVHQPQTEADLRLAQVLFDQLSQTPVESSFLPAAQHPQLQLLLQQLRDAPQDHRSLAAWASRANMTERTLARLCQRELGMGLGEWRQRMRYLHAVDALESGKGVQQIAFDLGYSTASAFIAMFQRVAGMSPEQFRREFGAAV